MAQLDNGDRTLLGFAAEHRLVLERQLERLLGSGGRELNERLAALTRERYLHAGWVFREPYYQIQRAGLLAIDSGLPTPRFSLAGYKHDVGLGWLWLAANGGTFGPLRELLSERALRSHDGALKHPSETYGVRLGGNDRYGHERLHYPDLLLIDPHGRRLALELELSPKGRDRRELILGGYGADNRIDGVLYLVEDHRGGRRIGQLIARSARQMGLGERVRIGLVKPLQLGAGEPSGETQLIPALPVPEAARSRPEAVRSTRELARSRPEAARSRPEAARSRPEAAR